ncbi:MAG: hypothetical protein ACXW11_00885 [Methylotenera sp.]
MKIINVIASLFAILFFITGSVVFDTDQDQMQTQTQDQVRDLTRVQGRDSVYGSQLMTSQELTEYHANMRNMKTQQEREAYSLEHQKEMQERARLGVTRQPTT